MFRGLKKDEDVPYLSTDEAYTKIQIDQKISGYTGTFLTQDGKTAIVEDGVIKSIA